MKKKALTLSVCAFLIAGCGSGNTEKIGEQEKPRNLPEITQEEPSGVPTESEISDEEPRASALAEEVEVAFSESYGWPEDDFWTPIVAFTDRDAPRVTVVTDLYPKEENEEEAMGICRAVTSIAHSVTTDFTGVYVTAGEGGAFLATCDVP